MGAREILFSWELENSIFTGAREILFSWEPEKSYFHGNQKNPIFMRTREIMPLVRINKKISNLF